MNRIVTPKIAVHATHETAALPARGAADLPASAIYDLWLATWETALAATTRSRALSTAEAAAHSALINAERKLLTKHFTLLLGRELLTRRASDNSWARSGDVRFDIR